MADIKLNELGTATDLAQAYVEDASGAQKRISKSDLSTAVGGVKTLKSNVITNNVNYVYGETSNGTHGKVSVLDIRKMTLVEQHGINPSQYADYTVPYYGIYCIISTKDANNLFIVFCIYGSKIVILEQENVYDLVLSVVDGNLRCTNQHSTFGISSLGLFTL